MQHKVSPVFVYHPQTTQITMVLVTDSSFDHSYSFEVGGSIYEWTYWLTVSKLRGILLYYFEVFYGLALYHPTYHLVLERVSLLFYYVFLVIQNGSSLSVYLGVHLCIKSSTGTCISPRLVVLYGLLLMSWWVIQIDLADIHKSSRQNALFLTLLSANRIRLMLATVKGGK